MNDSPYAENYSPSELIDLYLDGATSDAESTMLFDALSRNAELQLEFKGALALRTAAEYARESVVIPQETTAALFAKAGIVTGATAGGAAAFFGGAWAFLAAHAVKITVPAASALVGGILTYAAFVPPDASAPIAVVGAKTTAATAQHIAADAALPLNVPALLGAIPTEKHLADRTNRRAATAEATDNSPKTTAAGETLQAAAGDLAQAEESVAAAIEYAPEQRSRVGIFPANSTAAGSLGKIAYSTANSTGGEGGNVLVNIAQHAGIANFPDRSASGNEPALNNISLAVLYALTPDHAIGLEAGQETFPIYLVREGNYEQKPVMSYIGAAYRFMPQGWEILGGVRPFAQAFAGGAANGFVTKATLGIGWTPDRSVTLTLGAEAMSLFYQFQGNTYGAQKISLLYGAAISF